MSERRQIRLGTRGSALALTQSRWVARRLEDSGEASVAIIVIRTTGDEVLDRPLSEIGGKGLFTRELDRALLDDQIDLAVHSLKDLPTELPEGLALAGVPEREDPRDALVAPAGSVLSLDSMPSGAVIGTSSLRRQALLLAHRPDLRVRDIRGNLDTRLRKLDEGEYDALILATAGLRRMGWADRATGQLDPGSWIPAPGQGALGLVIRAGDEDLPGLRAMDHPPSLAAVTAERTLLHDLDAGCRLPVGALGLPYAGGMRLRGIVASPDGRRVVRAEATGAQDDPGALGHRVARTLVERGADALLREVRGHEGGGPETLISPDAEGPGPGPVSINPEIR